MECRKVTIDGSFGEGGGQILRTALALSLVTRKPFCIENIRAGRKKPGLLNQHLTAVNAATEVSRAQVKGNSLASTKLSFAPQCTMPGRYRFATGTAGSATLVLQTILPALLITDAPSELVFEGGTHNPFAPPFEFLAQTFLPIINRMGPTVTAKLERHGFFPAGGGRFTISIDPTENLAPIEFLERGKIVGRTARAIVSRLPRRIADREIQLIGSKLKWKKDWLHIEEISDSPGPGNVVLVEIESEYVTEVIAGFGRRGIPVEQMATSTAEAVKEYLDADVPVGKYLADQLLIPMVLAGGGKYRTLSLTDHTITNIQILRKFLNREITVSRIKGEVWEVGIVSK